MKTIFRKMPVMLLVAAVLFMGAGLVSSCKSSEPSMYERHQTNKGTKVNKNIKVKGSNKANGHTTRSY
ncbi:MAG: hypothetical protein J6W88_04360 [Bacteroidales bacterium]|nr:hypothetical protein [Bacteroidales bacterium]